MNRFSTARKTCDGTPFRQSSACSDGTISFFGAFDRDRPQQRRGMAWRFRTNTAAKTSL